MVDAYIDFAKGFRLTRHDPETAFWTVDSDNDELVMQYPFPEDFTYSNAQLLAGGIDGYPMVI